MRRSKGSRTGTRQKFMKKNREKGVLPVSRIIQKFEVGDKVHIDIDPSIQKGQPHPKFHGKTGKVIEKRGRSYLVEITDGKARKILISRPVHLLPQKGE